MLESKTTPANKASLSEARQVKALLRLVEDLGYEVQAGPAGDWTVSIRTDPGDRTVIGADSAREVVAAARRLADALQIDHKPAVLCTH